MATNITGLSPELLIHPGETLSEVLEDRNMNQNELAMRTGVSRKHISQVINGKASITAEFAAKLEYVLNIDASFWMNLQSEYDLEKAACEDQRSISDAEVAIAEQLKDIWAYMVKNLGFPYIRHYRDRVIRLRRFLDVSNLTLIARLQQNAIFRKAAHTTINPYVLFAWQKLCTMTVSDSQSTEKLDIDKLRQYLPKIKPLMFIDINDAINQLKKLFSECGISFTVIENFRGAPVQGYIERMNDGRLLLCLTIRGKRADIFWFSLFHEIAHILNEDFERGYVDYDFEVNERERLADEFAKNTLIDPIAYNGFIQTKGYESRERIIEFAKENGVLNYIVIGRLQKEKYLPWSAYSDMRVSYDW